MHRNDMDFPIVFISFLANCNAILQLCFHLLIKSGLIEQALNPYFLCRCCSQFHIFVPGQLYDDPIHAVHFSSSGVSLNLTNCSTIKEHRNLVAEHTAPQRMADIV